MYTFVGSNFIVVIFHDSTKVLYTLAALTVAPFIAKEFLCFSGLSRRFYHNYRLWIAFAKHEIVKLIFLHISDRVKNMLRQFCILQGLGITSSYSLLLDILCRCVIRELSFISSENLMLHQILRRIAIKQSKILIVWHAYMLSIAFNGICIFIAMILTVIV